MRILITGGAGFIGSSITKFSCDLGHEVTVFDDLSKGYYENVDKRAKFIKASLEDKKEIEKAMKKKDVVIHLAAESIIKDSIVNPEKTLKKNINYLINILESMRKQNVKFIVFSSSAAVYGEPKIKKPIKEHFDKKPLQPYGASKLANEAILYAYYHSFGINSVSLRYFNVYGPKDNQLPVTRAVPRWIKSILLNKPIELFWGGNQRRDYIFVEDLAKAHISVLGKKGLHVYNLGSGGKGKTMKEILESIFNLAGKRVEVIDAGERKGDPNFLVADISKIKKEMGWIPETSLKEGIKKTYEYYLNNPKSLEKIRGI
jgi:UDP-glucose 4-epimerase